MGIHSQIEFQGSSVNADDVFHPSCLPDSENGAFLNEISGAFDRVSKEIISSKLQGFGIGETCLRFLDSYLAPRIGNVVVQGKMSENMIQDNSVFQGTVLGPPLWKCFSRM